MKYHEEATEGEITNAMIVEAARDVLDLSKWQCEVVRLNNELLDGHMLTKLARSDGRFTITTEGLRNLADECKTYLAWANEWEHQPLWMAGDESAQTVDQMIEAGERDALHRSNVLIQARLGLILGYIVDELLKR